MSNVETVKSLFSKFNNVLEEGNIAAAVEFYHPDGVLIQKGEGKPKNGKEELTETFEQFMKLLGKSTTVLGDTNFNGITDYVIIDSSYTTTGENGLVVKGNFIQIWKKIGDTFKIYHDEFSVDK